MRRTTVFLYHIAIMNNNSDAYFGYMPDTGNTEENDSWRPLNQNHLGSGPPPATIAPHMTWKPSDVTGGPPYYLDSLPQRDRVPTIYTYCIWADLGADW